MRRPTRPKSSAVDAIQIIAVLEKPTGPELLLEKQFRPPTGKVTIEFPAGMVDEGETPEQAAVRELKEETGYVGEVIREPMDRPEHWSCKSPLGHTDASRYASRTMLTRDSAGVVSF